MLGYKITKENNLEVIPEEAELVRRIYDMYIGGAGCTAIAKKLTAEGIRNIHGNIWHPNTILGILENEKYMGDSLMGKTVTIDGVQLDNMDGRYAKRYYMEDTHEGIISKETYYKAQEIRQERKNDKVVGIEKPHYPFTSMIECSCCGKHYQHRVNNSGKKWSNHIWVCATQLRKGVAECDNTRLKDSVLREKFVAAYNQFVRERPLGHSIEAMQSVILDLRQEEKELAELRMQKLIPDRAYRAEQRRIKSQINALSAEINEQRSKTVCDGDMTPITEFDAEKVDKFITKVKISKGIITFVFYNGVEISRKYDNGPSGNQRGWKQKQQEEEAWQ